METIIFLSFFSALLGSFALAILVKAQDQSGFVSIDCEVPAAPNDETSDMKYVSDGNFIETETSTLAKQFCGVRSFLPEGMKNCYTLLSAQAEEDSERNALTSIELVERLKNGSLNLSLEENPSLCSSVSSQQKDKKFKIPLISSAVRLFVLLIALTFFLRHKRRKQQALVENRNNSPELKNRHLTYSEVLQITNNFKRVLGKGGFGTVYHGYLNDTQVAMKMLSSSSSGQEYEEFQAEVEILMGVHHRNLTKLIGYCNEDANRGLVYEYVANGNLQEHLSDRNAAILSWEDRLRIALDVAQGLEYLHRGCKSPTVHGNIKSANILLNENLEAKLTDFGLWRNFPMEDSTHVSSTRGYLDPEYYETNRLNEKTDVYSFGVVLMEIITSRPVILENENENTHISQWIIDRVETGNMENIADPSLEGDFGTSSAWKVLELALACAYHVSSKRPTMDEVVMELKECLAMEIAVKKEQSGQTWRQ
ncbi:hypothetical protein ACOSQ3_020561 [Xanthoceras sorbifolium]